MFKIIMTLGKVLQRHAYDLLSHKYSVVIILISFCTILVSVFQFGEVWMTWSQEKYQAVFNSFSDNIVGKSLQSKLCQNVPIDVVYTWVNGSDPMLLQQLQDYRLQLQEETSKKCPHPNCVPSHIISFRQWLSDEMVADILPMIGVKDINISLAQRVRLGQSNWTLIELNSPGDASIIAKTALHPNITAYLAHWTSGTSPSNVYNDTNAIIISGAPPDLVHEAGRMVHAWLTEGLQEEIHNFWLYSDKRLIVVMLNSAMAVDRIIQMSNVTIGGHSVNVSRAHLLMELPLIGNSKDFSPSRFEDKEELRYSLRSLEQFAPWVRHVYLVTNGQIPYWLDLENPRLIIITHEIIFPDPKHLPTFSSPAIESHLHRIPGLSKQFLYLNDDVMFGKEVWPDDFITNANGQKVYLSWPVPDCSDSCPWSWVADGSCDVSCNTSECSFDGGDCDLSAEDDLAAYDENRHLVNYDDDVAPYNDNQRNQIRDHLNDNLFRNMNFGGDIVLEDLPDPGKRMNSLLDILIKKNVKKDEFKNNFTLFGELEEENQVKVKSNSNNNNNANNSLIRNSSTIHPEIVQIPGFAFNVNENNVLKRVERNIKEFAQIQGNTTVKNYINASRTFLPTVLPVSNGSVINNSRKMLNESAVSDHVTLSFVQKLFGNSSFNEFGTYGEFYPKLERENVKIINNTLNTMGKKRLVKKLLKQRKIPLNSHYEGETLEIKHENQNSSYRIKSNHSYETEKLMTSHAIKVKTLKNNSYNTKLNKLYQKLNGRSDEPERVLGRHQHSDYDDWRSEERISLNAKKKQKPSRIFDSQLYNISPTQGKKSQDTFAESLLYVNRLFNLEFGFEPRKVPAHMPHLIDIDIMEKLQARFSKEWQLTSSHKVRSAQDMQFAFSYFYFLMSNKENVPVSDIFDTFDTDNSGTWSDREIRTLLTRCFELPLNYARVVKFESDITNCSKDLPVAALDSNISTPPYERYQDSKLPVVSKKLIFHCKPIADLLKKKFGKRKLYRYQIEKEKHQDISFKMLNSNISQLVSHLDDIRRDPKKFICLNDNLDPERTEDNAVARAILQDMYESLFPKPSSFELPPEFRNRFLHVSELQAWRKGRNTVRTVVYICLAILIAFTLVNFFHVECRWLQRKLFHRTRSLQSSTLVPCV